VGSDGGGIRVRWGLSGDEAWLVRLLEMNGLPRFAAFEERFVVAEMGGEVLAALRYRTASKRLLVGPPVVDPWAGEERLAVALYRGAGALARELGATEVLAEPFSHGEYPREAGYRRRRGGWRLDAASDGAGERSDPLGGCVGPVCRPVVR